MGFAIDRTRPPWERQAGGQDFPAADQTEFSRALADLDRRLAEAATSGQDGPASAWLLPDCRWNPLVDAVSTWFNGAELDRISVLDYAAYDDTEVNWRVRDGYGAAIAALAAGIAPVLDCPVEAIDLGARPIRLETPRGTVRARAVILCVPTTLAQGRIALRPGLPDKLEAAAGLPLGLADKVFLGTDEPEAFPAEGHLFGRPDRTQTGSYHLRPFGRPYIEVFLGGRCAGTLEAEGPGAAAAFAGEELAGLFGSDVRQPAGTHVRNRLAARALDLGLLFSCSAGLRRRPRGPGPPHRGAAVLGRRGDPSQRLFHRPRRVAHGPSRRRRGVIQPGLGLSGAGESRLRSRPGLARPQDAGTSAKALDSLLKRRISDVQT